MWKKLIIIVYLSLSLYLPANDQEMSAALNEMNAGKEVYDDDIENVLVYLKHNPQELPRLYKIINELDRRKSLKNRANYWPLYLYFLDISDDPDYKMALEFCSKLDLRNSEYFLGALLELKIKKSLMSIVNKKLANVGNSEKHIEYKSPVPYFKINKKNQDAINYYLNHSYPLEKKNYYFNSFLDSDALWQVNSHKTLFQFNGCQWGSNSSKILPQSQIKMKALFKSYIKTVILGKLPASKLLKRYNQFSDLSSRDIESFEKLNYLSLFLLRLETGDFKRSIKYIFNWIGLFDSSREIKTQITFLIIKILKQSQINIEKFAVGYHLMYHMNTDLTYLQHLEPKISSSILLRLLDQGLQYYIPKDIQSLIDKEEMPFYGLEETLEDYQFGFSQLKIKIWHLILCNVAERIRLSEEDEEDSYRDSTNYNQDFFHKSSIGTILSPIYLRLPKELKQTWIKEIIKNLKKEKNSDLIYLSIQLLKSINNKEAINGIKGLLDSTSFYAKREAYDALKELNVEIGKELNFNPLEIQILINNAPLLSDSIGTEIKIGGNSLGGSRKVDSNGYLSIDQGALFSNDEKADSIEINYLKKKISEDKENFIETFFFLVVKTPLSFLDKGMILNLDLYPFRVNFDRSEIRDSSGIEEMTIQMKYFYKRHKHDSDYETIDLVSKKSDRFRIGQLMEGEYDFKLDYPNAAKIIIEKFEFKKGVDFNIKLEPGVSVVFKTNIREDDLYKFTIKLMDKNLATDQYEYFKNEKNGYFNLPYGEYRFIIEDRRQGVKKANRIIYKTIYEKEIIIDVNSSSSINLGLIDVYGLEKL